MAKKRNRKKDQNISNINYITWLAVGVFDYLNSSILYTGYLPILALLFQHTLRFIFLPIYAFNTIIYPIFALINFYYTRDKNDKIQAEHVVRFVINILSAIIVASAVTGGLFFAASLGMIVPLLYATNLALSVIYNFAFTAYHLYHYLRKDDPIEKAKHMGSIKAYAAVGITALMFATAGACIVSGLIPFAALGVAAGLIGASFFAIALVDAIKWQMQQKPGEDDDLSLVGNDEIEVINAGNTLSISQRLTNGFQALTEFLAAKPAKDHLSDDESDDEQIEQKQKGFVGLDDVLNEFKPVVLVPEGSGLTKRR
jgi:hypothetical protein